MSDKSASTSGAEGPASPQYVGFAAIPNWLVRDEKFGTHDKIVYVVLASHVTRDDSWAMTHAHIAREAGVSVSTVQRALDRLREAGLITWVGRADPETGAQLGNAYRVYSAPLGQPDVPPRSVGPTPPVSVTDVEKNPLEEPKNPPTPQEDGDFEALWYAWPKKVAKMEAQRAWTRLSRKEKNAAIPGLILLANAHRQHTPPQFYPSLAKIIRDKRWNEAPPVARDQGRYKPEPPRPQTLNIPPGHKIKWSDDGYAIGSEPIE